VRVRDQAVVIGRKVQHNGEMKVEYIAFASASVAP